MLARLDAACCFSCRYAVCFFAAAYFFFRHAIIFAMPDSPDAERQYLICRYFAAAHLAARAARYARLCAPRIFIIDILRGALFTRNNERIDARMLLMRAAFAAAADAAARVLA